MPMRGDAIMETGELIRTYAIGAVLGAVLAVFAGFSIGGWLTAGRAGQIAAAEARDAVVAAFVPVCLERAYKAPDFVEILVEIKGAAQNNRTKILIQAGWAAVPLSSNLNLAVADACMSSLSARE
jgi:hypothetical protein